jgi:DNA-binding NtrC family response regulator
MRRPKLLVVDDGDRHVELMHAFLQEYDYATRCELPGPCWRCEARPGCTLTHAHDFAELDEALSRHRDVDVVLLDVAFDLPAERLVPSDAPLERRRRLQGIDILTRLRRRRPELPVVLMTSREELAAEEVELGHDDLVAVAGADAFDARAIGMLVERTLAYRQAGASGAGYLFGDAPAMRRLERDAATLARTSLPVLILGESGTGKSALAESALHAGSGRRGPFVSVDLASIPPTLAAAELFGSARGAFSGAVDRGGRFEAAHGGTLFLDEIGNLPLDVQRLLLLALEERRVTRLGESAPRAVDVRLVAATNADLAAAVAAGTFRADLHARLNPAARLVVPPLRERIGDLPALARLLARRALLRDSRLVEEYGQAARIGVADVDVVFGRPPARPDGLTFVFATASVRLLERHAWPGNVRELGLLVGTACVFALADAVEAARQGRAVEEAAHLVPIPPSLVRRLLAVDETARGGLVSLAVEPRATLHEAARSLEAQLYERLFKEHGGDFGAMAERLLSKRSADAARKVRLRFNQLGLRARSFKK